MLTSVQYALTVAQPAATLIVEGPRRFDNRVRRPPARLLGQRIAIFAGPKPDLEDGARTMQMLEALGISEATWSAWKTRTIHGAIIGTAVFAGVFTENDDRWFTGPWGIWLTQPELLAEPVKVAGGKGFWGMP